MVLQGGGVASVSPGFLISLSLCQGKFDKNLGKKTKEYILLVKETEQTDLDKGAVLFSLFFSPGDGGREMLKWTGTGIT